MRSWPIRWNLFAASMVSWWTRGSSLHSRVPQPRVPQPGDREPGATPEPISARRSAGFAEFAEAADGFGIFDLDLVTGQVTGTPLFFELSGLSTSPRLFTRDDWFTTVHPEDLQTVIERLNAAISAVGAFEAEYRVLLLEGSPRWLVTRGRVLKETTGLPSHAIGTVEDITERKHTEAALY